MNRKLTSMLLAAWLMPLFFLFCTNDYNPFTDQSKARAVVTHKTFRDVDTLSIFTTETLMVQLAVRELVDSFSVVAPSNRRAADTFVVRKTAGQILPAGPYTCLISLTDTGWITITVNTFRSNGERVPQDFFVFCKSPLGQGAITGDYGDTLRLSTAPVRDADVAYHWDFGNGVVVNSPLPQTTAVIKMQTVMTAGSLWVSDPSGGHASPRCAFAYNLTDSTAPIIMCANDQFVGKDTIVTGDTTFYFKVKIWDPAQVQPVYSAMINGGQFDINNDPYYVQVFGRMDTFKVFSPVVVTAIDNQYSQKSSRKTFWLRFSDSLSHGKGLYITVSEPEGDLSASSVRQVSIFGNVEDYAHDSINAVLKLFVNDLPTGESYAARGKYSVLWNFGLTLGDGANKIKVAAYSPGGDSLAEKSFTIFFDPGLKDTVPPVILEITANGKTADYHFVTTDTAAIRIIAFDEGSGIDSLTVNGKRLLMTPEGNGFIWFDSVIVVHRPSGNLFCVRAKDRAGNRDSVSFTLYMNNPPEIILAPAVQNQVFAGALFSSQIRCIDRDLDTIRIQKVDGPANLTVTADGQISWTPLPADSGMHTVLMRVSDGYQDVFYTFQVTVLTVSALPQMARIDTQHTAYAPYVEAGKDSLVILVRTLYDTLDTPLVFSAFLYNSPLPMNGRLLVWKPEIKDVGIRSVKLKITDPYSRSDSMLAVVTVVPPNQPCTLHVTYNIPTTPAGELDLSSAAQPETLFFSVKDPDIPAVERDTVKIRWPASQTQMVLDSTRQFLLILAPKSGTKTKDTVCVSVSDRGGHADSMKFFISYGATVTPGFTGKIVINTRSSGASISAPVTGFPLLVRLDTTSFTRKNFSDAAPNGADVRFKKPDGTPLPYQIERWNGTAYLAEIWVKVDTVYPMNDTQYITMTWGAGSLMDSSNGRAVFDTAAGYVGVWHMSDGSQAQNANSAQAQFNAVPTLTSGPAPGVIITYGTGIIGGAADSMINDRFLNAGLLPTMQNVSVSAWVNPAARAGFSKIISKSWNTYQNPYQVFSLEETGPKDTAVQFHVGLSGQFSAYAVYKDSIPIGSWTHLAGTYDGMTMRLYVNGTEAATYSWTSGSVPAVPLNQMPWTIGGWGGNTMECFQGKIDEARIYRGVWTADYIKLSYENQREGGALLQFR
ncbi:MAG TPA: DUF2341 domain-containing protein [Chitinivibrionales bacterium]|nr:DUF2341 domain-containing protein [Chitinivibrionales bacterium]